MLIFALCQKLIVLLPKVGQTGQPSGEEGGEEVVLPPAPFEVGGDGDGGGEVETFGPTRRAKTKLGQGGGGGGGGHVAEEGE